MFIIADRTHVAMFSHCAITDIINVQRRTSEAFLDSTWWDLPGWSGFSTAVDRALDNWLERRSALTPVRSFGNVDKFIDHHCEQARCKQAERSGNSEQRSVERWRAKRAATTHTECNFYVDVDAYDLTQWHWTLEWKQILLSLSYCETIKWEEGAFAMATYSQMSLSWNNTSLIIQLVQRFSG